MSVSDSRSGKPDLPAPRDPYQHLAEGEVSLLRILSVLLKRWRVLTFLPLGATAVTAVASFFVSPTFTATSSFVPEVRSSSRLAAGGGLAGLAGLASQFGVSLGSDGSQSPRFYAQLATSREILERLLLTRFPIPGAPSASDSAPLLQIFAAGGRSLPDSLQRAVKRLRKRLAVRVDNQTSVVTLSVDAKDAAQAASIANRLVDYLNEFNAQVRQSQAREKRRFVEQRVAEGEGDLKNAEEALRGFYEKNRSWQQAPQLVFEEGRLRRQVDIRQDLYLTLRREYESARIEEVNDIPVITVIDPAVPPQRRSWPKRALLVTLALVLGFMVSTAWAFGADYLDRARQDGESDYLEFASLMTRARQDVSRMLSRKSRRESS